MERPPLIPFTIIRGLKCRNCQNVVSCGPVHAVPDESILCGRCQQIAKPIYRNFPFEALSSIFLYPCQYWEEHCPKILNWNECYVHENGCSYKGRCGLFWKHPRAFVKGKRDMPHGDIRLVPIPENLLDYIKCSLCEGYLSCEPVIILPNGNNICHRCGHNNGYPADGIRNTSYETLSSIIIFPCVYRNKGCPIRLKFGTDLWHHESECSYNQMYRKNERWIPVNKFNDKSDSDYQSLHTDLIKSLKNKQSKKYKKAEEIAYENISKTNSEINSIEPSVDGDNVSEKDVSCAKSVSSESSTPPTLRTDESDSRRVTPQPPRNYPAYANYENIKQNSKYFENINVAQVHQDNNGSTLPQDTYPNTLTNPEVNMYHNDNLQRSDSYTSQIYEPVIYRNSYGLKPSLQEFDYKILAGHYPVFINPYGQGLIPKPTIRGVVRTDSLSSNRELIEELKTKQLAKRRMEQKEIEPSPYKECQNLEDILQVHDTIKE